MRGQVTLMIILAIVLLFGAIVFVYIEGAQAEGAAVELQALSVKADKDAMELFLRNQILAEIEEYVLPGVGLIGGLAYDPAVMSDSNNFEGRATSSGTVSHMLINVVHPEWVDSLAAINTYHPVYLQQFVDNIKNGLLQALVSDTLILDEFADAFALWDMESGTAEVTVTSSTAGDIIKIHIQPNVKMKKGNSVIELDALSFFIRLKVGDILDGALKLAYGFNELDKKLVDSCSGPVQKLTFVSQYDCPLPNSVDALGDPIPCPISDWNHYVMQPHDWKVEQFHKRTNEIFGNTMSGVTFPSTLDFTFPTFELGMHVLFESYESFPNRFPIPKIPMTLIDTRAFAGTGTAVPLVVDDTYLGSIIDNSDFIRFDFHFGAQVRNPCWPVV